MKGCIAVPPVYQRHKSCEKHSLSRRLGPPRLYSRAEKVGYALQIHFLDTSYHLNKVEVEIATTLFAITFISSQNWRLQPFCYHSRLWIILVPWLSCEEKEFLSYSNIKSRPTAAATVSFSLADLATCSLIFISQCRINSALFSSGFSAGSGISSIPDPEVGARFRSMSQPKRSRFG